MFSRPALRLALLVTLFWLWAVPLARAQTAATGSLAGLIKDPSGRPVPGASVTAISPATGLSRQTQTDLQGQYRLPLLPPGDYDLAITADGFAPVQQRNVVVRVTETTVLDVGLQLAAVTAEVTVEAAPELIQTASPTLGRVVDERQVSNLPLATRNYTQILGLSPGVVSEIADAGALGRNTQEVSALGARRSDNNVRVNGMDANNVFVTNMGSGGGAQGVAVPSPDSIQEFKVQTGLYDATTGRNGGAHINVITKSGSNAFHGTAYEFLRNETFNANEYFRERLDLPKPKLRQHQFGFTFGGPIRRNRTFFFASYEGSRQTNGVTGGATSTVFLPPLTDDRSAAALGRIFGGQRGQFGGVPVAPDGSNIHPVALALLQKRLADGTYLIPTPQRILPNGSGQSSFSVPATYDENQFNANIDRQFGAHRLAVKYFFADTETEVPFGAGATVPGFPSLSTGRNHNFSAAWTHVIGSRAVSDARFAFTRLNGLATSVEPVTAASVGMRTPVTIAGLPNIGFLTSNLLFGAAQPPLGSDVQNYELSNVLTLDRGRHLLRIGGEFKHIRNDVVFDFDRRAVVRLFTFPDFLIGLPSPANGAAAPVSNVFVSSARAGLIGRAQRFEDFSAFVQDDITMGDHLTLNLGVRYEYFGQVRDSLGRLSNFDLASAVPEPPASGTFSGFVAAQNTSGMEPAGVVRRDSDTVVDPDWNNVAPRVGFAWKPFGSNHWAVRGGYGTYFSRPGTVIMFQSGPNLPFAVISTRSGPANREASLDAPFDPTLPPPDAFPVYLPRNAGSNIFVNPIDSDLHAPVIHQYGVNVQRSLAGDYLVEVGYVGSRGTDLIGRYRFNQPLLASAAQPVHGITTNTVANAALRAPIQGIDPASSQLHTNGFESSYNALLASVTKRFSHGLQFLASYTLGHATDNLSLSDLEAVGGYVGDVSDFDLNEGDADTDRRHRFVTSFYWELPGGGDGRGLSAVLDGWAITGILTWQSGLPFSVLDTTAGSIFATTSSRAQFADGRDAESVAFDGDVEGRLDRYFDTSGFTNAPAIGDGRGFGNSGRNILRGPSQRNLDLAIIKRTRVTDASDIELRVELFNALNWVNFGLPGNNRAAPASFGIISNTTVAPRIMQFGLKYNF